MATLGNDCYFFCTSTCAKGAACPFRHVEAAKTCRIICQHWQMGVCLRPMCKFRHSDFIIQIDTSEVPCYWESQPAGCMKKNCPYKHSKPAVQEEKTAEGDVSQQVEPTVGPASSTEDIKAQNVVQPVVTSTATQPSIDLEKTSSSQKPVALQESEIQVNADKQKAESDDSKDSKADNNKLSIAVQEPQVRKKKVKVSPVSKIKQKSVAAMKKKIHKNIADSFARASTIKAKKLHDQPRKSVKDRLGRAPVYQPRVSLSPEESDSESDSESDDSIENIKVMSVEEILRQKALESMMRKRAKEKKTMQEDAPFAIPKEQTPLPAAERKVSSLSFDRKIRRVQQNVAGLGRKSKTNITTRKLKGDVPFAVLKEQTPLPAADRKMSSLSFGRETRTLQQNVQGLGRKSKASITTRKVKHVASPVNSSSSSSSEEESDDERKTMKRSSDSSSDSSDSSSASSSSDTDENSTDDSEEIDIRRVVVDLESEKAARKKAKESLKKQKLNAVNTQDNIRKRRVSQTMARQAKTSEVQKTEIREQRARKRSVNVDYDSDDFACSRVQEPLKLHIRDRLGKSTSLHKASSDPRLISRAEKFGSNVFSTSVVNSKVKPVRVLNVPKSSSSEDESDPLTEVKVKTLEEIRTEKMKMAQKNGQKLSTQEGVDSSKVKPVRILNVSKSSSSEVESDPLTEVKVKTLEEIRAEKMKMVQKNGQKLSTQECDSDIQTPVSIKDRLGTPPRKMQRREVVHSEARHVVLLNGAECDDKKEVKPSDEPKKIKKRPWRSVRPKANPSAVDTIASDERTPVVSSPSPDRDEYSIESDHHKDIRAIDESPFERLRRRALMKKLQAAESQKLKISPLIGEEKTKDDDDDLKKPELCPMVEISSSVKTHKHKHSHKHKRVKTERQIYMPPAMKSAVTVTKPSLLPESVPPKLIAAPATKVSPLKREPHPIAAAWTAGLTLSSKGIPVRRSESNITPSGSVEISSRMKAAEQPGDRSMVVRSKETVSSSKIPDPAPESTVTIKSFAEIMAEKRKRRLEMQAQKTGANDPSTAATSSSEPSSVFSLSASSFLPGNSYQLNTNISQSVDVQSTLPLAYTTDRSSDTAKSITLAGLATKQPLVNTTPDSSDIVVSSVSSSRPAVPSSSSSSSQGLVRSVGEKVKLKSRKKSLDDKRKKVQKISTKSNNLEQSSQSCVVTSEDCHILSSSFYPDTSSLSQTVTSSTNTTSLSSGGSNKTTHSTHRPISTSVIGPSPSHVLENVTTTEELSVADNGNVPKLPKNTSDVNEGTYSSKQNVAALKEDSTHTRKNTRLSLEDEFNFFEDEEMVIEDTNILENIEPIDNLLQDIDDLLS